MINSINWKGIDSNTLDGLLICELPPITKPKMRVKETFVDGVDGSFIEELGYESYDKTIKMFRVGVDRDRWLRHKGTMCLKYDTRELLWND